MTIIVAAVVVIPALVASLIYLAIQVREAHAAEELARKASSSSAVRKDTEGRLKG